jgi:uncharacterized protein YkwD
VILAEINALRIARGRGILRPSATLHRIAQRHAQAMADADRLWHQELPPDLPPGWTLWGEVVGHGPRGRIVGYWRRSDEHRTVMLLARFKLAGVGLVKDPDARGYFAAVCFLDPD